MVNLNGEGHFGDKKLEQKCLKVTFPLQKSKMAYSPL